MASSFTSYSDVETLNFLHVVQAFLGDITSWPSRILTLIFIDEFTIPNVTETVAFFFGNMVPLGAAMAFYIECSGHSPLRTVIHFTSLYQWWQTRPNVDHSTVSARITTRGLNGCKTFTLLNLAHLTMTTFRWALMQQATANASELD
jgi:hypothetical protein